MEEKFKGLCKAQLLSVYVGVSTALYTRRNEVVLPFVSANIVSLSRRVYGNKYPSHSADIIFIFPILIYSLRNCMHLNPISDQGTARIASFWFISSLYHKNNEHESDTVIRPSKYPQYPIRFLSQMLLRV